METEDLDYNPFFSALQKKFPKLYEKAQEPNNLICVPHSKFLQGFKPSQPVFEKHILVPSPFFKGEYESFAKPPIKLRLQDGLLQVTLPSSEKFDVRVLSEEQYYNKAFQPFRVFCIEGTLEKPTSAVVTSGGSPSERAKDKSKEEIFHSRSTFEENLAFLSSHTAVMKPLNELTNLFNEGYLIVDGYLDHLSEKLASIRDELHEVALRSPDFASLRSDHRLPNVINDAIECCMFYKVYDKSFRAIQKHNEAKNAELAAVLHKAASLPPDAFGVALKAPFDLEHARGALKSITKEKSPVTKFVALRNTLAFLSEEAKRCSPAGFVLTTDDLLPLLSMAIAQAGVADLPSHLDYMERFGWTPKTVAEFPYVLVTLEAALAHLHDIVGPTGKETPKQEGGLRQMRAQSGSSETLSTLRPRSMPAISMLDLLSPQSAQLPEPDVPTFDAVPAPMPVASRSALSPRSSLRSAAVSSSGGSKTGSAASVGSASATGAMAGAGMQPPPSRTASGKQINLTPLNKPTKPPGNDMGFLMDLAKFHVDPL